MITISGWRLEPVPVSIVSTSSGVLCSCNSSMIAQWMFAPCCAPATELIGLKYEPLLGWRMMCFSGFTCRFNAGAASANFFTGSKTNPACSFVVAAVMTWAPPSPSAHVM